MIAFNLLLFVISLFLLYRGAGYLVDHASHLATEFGVTPIVIALTIVAFGTSAPELVASVAAALDGKSDLVMGNNVGSNIANIGLILGFGAVIRSIKVRSETLKREIPFFIGAAILLFFMSLDGVIGRFDGAVFIVLTISFFLFLIYFARKERVFDEALAQVKAKIEHKKTATNIFMILFGLILLVIGAKFLVSSASFIALSFGVSQAIIGITIVALGTSLPELVTSIVASFRRNNEIVIGNVIGSNILNIFLILGVTALLVPISVAPDIIKYDIPIMLLFSLLVVAIMRTKLIVSRLEGLVLMLSYVAYIAYVIMR